MLKFTSPYLLQFSLMISFPVFAILSSMTLQHFTALKSNGSFSYISFTLLPLRFQFSLPSFFCVEVSLQRKVKKC